MAASHRGTDLVDVDRAAATLVLAFASDPQVRWWFHDAEVYARAFREVLERTRDVAVVDVDETGGGAAVWMPPGIRLDAEIVEVVLGHVEPDRHQDVLAQVEQAARYVPTAPHWYLMAIGVDPCRQGQGLGSALLRQGLDRCDRDGLPAYLESAHPRNRALYERHGFERLAEFRAADAPSVWPMLR